MTSLIPLIAERILNSLPLGLLIALLAWLFLRVGAYRNSRIRFAVWFTALLAIAALPALQHGPLRGPQSAQGAEIIIPSYVAPIIFAVWLVLFLFAVTRIVVGLRSLRALRQSSQELNPADCDPLVSATVAAMQNSRKVSVRVSEVQAVPAALGFFAPVILMPGWAIRELPAQELRTILLHEFAHIERHDSWTNLAQKLIKAIFFFHPAVWWIEQRLCLEREMACDDAVVSATGDAQAYAACLVSLAERSFINRSLALAQAVVSRVCETSARVGRILNTGAGSERVWKPALALFATVAAGVALLPATPHLIAFQQPESRTQLATSSTSDSPSRAALKIDPASTPMIHLPIVPASFKPPVATHRGERRKKLVASVPQPPQAGKVVLAKTESQPPSPASMFLVVRTTEFDGMGRAFLSVTVWRVSLDPRTLPAEQSGIVPKSI